MTLLLPALLVGGLVIWWLQRQVAYLVAPMTRLDAMRRLLDAKE